MSSWCVECWVATRYEVTMFFEEILPPARVVDPVGVVTVAVARYAWFLFLGYQCADQCSGTSSAWPSLKSVIQRICVA